MSWAERDGVALADALARMTVGPAAVLNIDGGHVAAGQPADLCVFDPKAPWVIDAGSLRSQSKNTPFFGHELVGKVRYTIVGGELVFEDAPR